MELRKVLRDDVKIVYDWANDSITRKYSFTDNEINYKDHQSWFQDKLDSNKCLFLMFLKNKKRIGVVRFDFKKNYWLVSINIGPDSRGKGYSVEMLKSANKYLRDLDSNPIHAYIKKDNIASVKAFESAGYQREKLINYKGHKSYLYIWK